MKRFSFFLCFALASTLAVGAPALASHHEGGKAHQGSHGDSTSPRAMMRKHHPVRGPLAEGLASFHDTLHPLVHDVMPKGDLAAVKAKVPELRKKAEALKAVPLPPSDRLRRSRRDDLLRAVADLEAATGDDKAFQAAFDWVHHSFEELARATKDTRDTKDTKSR